MFGTVGIQIASLFVVIAPTLTTRFAIHIGEFDYVPVL
jgi:hypothetical protein